MEARSVRASLFTAGVLAAFALVLVRFHFFYGYPFGDSTRYNVPWSGAFTAQIASGDLYPRWLFDYPENIGSPVFYFYGPLPFYTASALHFVLPGLSITSQLTALHLLMYWLAGVTYFFFVRKLIGGRFALLGAMLYMALPYHFLDIEMRNAFGEGFAYICLPLMLSGLQYCPPGGKRWIVAIAGYAGIIYSHIPSALLITPIMVVWTAVCYRGDDIGRGLIRLGLVGSGGVLLAAPYLLPALGLRPLLRQDAWLADPHFLPENWLLPHGFSFSTGAVFYGSILFAAVLGLGAALCVIASPKSIPSPERSAGRVDKLRATAAACAIGIAFILFMMSEPSKWIWLNIGPLRNTQFPFRLGVAADFLSATALIIALRLALAKIRYDFRPIWLVYILLLTVAGTSLLARLDAVSYIYLDRPPTLDSDALHCCILPDEYWLPAVVRSDLYREAAGPERYQALARTFSPIEAFPPAGTDERLKMERAGSTLRIHANVKNATEVRIAQAYFPLWSLKDISTGRELPLRADPQTGMILATIPADSRELQLELKITPYQIWGNVAGLLGLLQMVALLWRRTP
ncbi:hypothetical protein QTL95_26090 [Rhizobium sp. S152]|uniref:hypothetical protein n=1 Tax=Rhizobium sp. S152 TaxID=3055038 RepID=UPI0025AA0026|nr:hypothetical protein [Rhizobium sp. S152]MDM9629363.1 hypothetical protein [Rhizobium sp. S152]